MYPFVVDVKDWPAAELQWWCPACSHTLDVDGNEIEPEGESAMTPIGPRIIGREIKKGEEKVGLIYMPATVTDGLLVRDLVVDFG